MVLLSDHLDILQDVTHYHDVFASLLRGHLSLQGCRLRLRVEEILFIHGMNNRLQIINSDVVMVVKGICNDAHTFILKEVLPHLLISDFSIKENGIE